MCVHWWCGTMAGFGSEVLVLVQKDGQVHTVFAHIHSSDTGSTQGRPASDHARRPGGFNFSYCCAFCSSSPWNKMQKSNLVVTLKRKREKWFSKWEIKSVIYFDDVLQCEFHQLGSNSFVQRRCLWGFLMLIIIVIHVRCVFTRAHVSTSSLKNRRSCCNICWVDNCVRTVDQE